MKRTRFTALAGAALAILLAPGVVAAAMRPANYVVLKAGGFFPQGSDVDVFDAGFDGEIDFGRHVAPGFAFEGGVGYFTMSGDAAKLGSPGVEEDITVVPVTLSLKGTYPVGPFEPYAFAGIGVYFLDDELGGSSESDTEVGYHVGAGATYDVNPRVFLGVEGRYLFLRATTFGAERRFDGITLAVGVGTRF